MTIFKVLGLKSIDIYAIPVNSSYIQPTYASTHKPVSQIGKKQVIIFKHIFSTMAPFIKYVIRRSTMSSIIVQGGGITKLCRYVFRQG